MQKKYTFVYVYDALCGWCYGFSPVVEQLYNKYQDDIRFSVISGGMILGERIGPIGEVAGYIKEAYKQVEQTCGVKFGAPFLNETLEQGEAIFSSHLPAVALTVFRDHHQGQDVLFASALQKAIYYDGRFPNEFSTYEYLAQQFSIDPKTFVEKMKLPKFHARASADFDFTRQFKVTGFPTVFLANDQRILRIGSGYSSFEQLDTILQEHLD